MKKSRLDYPINVLISERDDVHSPLKSQVAQLQEAIDILTNEKYKRVREEFKAEVEKKKMVGAISNDFKAAVKKKETGVVDKHLFKK